MLFYFGYLHRGRNGWPIVSFLADRTNGRAYATFCVRRRRRL